MHTYLVNYKGFDAQQRFLRGGLAIRVQAHNNGEAITKVEQEIKTRFPDISLFVCDSCLSEEAVNIYERAKKKLK